MKIYIDSEFHCHIANPEGTFREISHPFFQEKCAAFIEGFCYDDSNETIYIYPWKPYDELDAAQRQYEQALILDMQNALNTLGVNVDG